MDTIMMDGASLGLVTAIILAVTGFYLYVKIIKRRNDVEEALGGIDAALQQRADLVGNVLDVARKAIEHETELVHDATRLREKVGTETYDRTDPEAVKGHIEDAQKLSEVASAVMLRMEDYPEMQADETLIEAQRTYSRTEESLAAARRFYNSAVADLNDLVRIFPASLIASALGIRAMPAFEATHDAHEPIRATDRL